MNEDYKKEILLDNYQNPFNRGLINNKEYIIVKLKSKNCIDQIDLQIKAKDDIIEDIRFDGEACAICTSSTSILVKNLKGKKILDALNMINNFNNMIEEKEYNKDILNEAIIYENISKQPNRKNCATLSWNGVKKYIEGELKNE